MELFKVVLTEPLKRRIDGRKNLPHLTEYESMPLQKADAEHVIKLLEKLGGKCAMVPANLKAWARS